MTGAKSADPRGFLRHQLPPVPQGWVRRDYLRGEGEAVVQGAHELGRTARLRAGGDLERFGFYTAGGGDQLAQVYAKGDQRIVLGLRRPPRVFAPGKAALAVTALAHGAEMPHEAEIVAGDLIFRRRVRALPETEALMPYDFYRADAPGGMVIELISNTPLEEVEAFLARIDLARR
ncbi:hypothetical protein [Marimonas arenosa]|uniref:Uncharacterized protein n=1 Tax=Marimonas arenosa TaxID=1795305 RepID=A0AAE3WG11_9RHOB|nr:hypothetical protein [Marimonas arenosa]MDQ2091964.1 hypothetical protein [Marimonas arenosa]